MSPSQKMSRLIPASVALSLVAIISTPAFASTGGTGELEVRVTGEPGAAGVIGCALYAGEGGFPMDSSRAAMIWLPWKAEGVRCRFAGLLDGTYAVSVMNDENGNRKVDTNFVGMPLEAWGASNNVRPALRAPRFSEAAFRVEGPVTYIDVRIAK